MNTPFGNSITTAEHAIALMFALARQIPGGQCLDPCRQVGEEPLHGRRDHRQDARRHRLRQYRLDRRHARRRPEDAGHRLRSVPVGERADELGVEKVELDELFARADFITLHTPLTDKTRNIIDAAAIAKMKDGVRIINCARGGLVVEADLVAALKTGKVAGAGIDVFEVEPATENPLFGLANVVARRISAPRPPRRRRMSRCRSPSRCRTI